MSFTKYLNTRKAVVAAVLLSLVVNGLFFYLHQQIKPPDFQEIVSPKPPGFKLYDATSSSTSFSSEEPSGIAALLRAPDHLNSEKGGVLRVSVTPLGWLRNPIVLGTSAPAGPNGSGSPGSSDGSPGVSGSSAGSSASPSGDSSVGSGENPPGNDGSSNRINKGAGEGSRGAKQPNQQTECRAQAVAGGAKADTGGAKAVAGGTEAVAGGAKADTVGDCGSQQQRQRPPAPSDR